MYVNELKLFYIGTINFPLKTMEIVVVNIIQTKRIIKTTNTKVEPSCNFKNNAKIALEKKLEVSLEGQKTLGCHNFDILESIFKVLF